MSATAEGLSVNRPSRRAGAAQAWVLILTMFLPILAIIALAPALPTLLDHFKDVPNAKTVVPILLTVPALCIAVFGGVAGWLTDRFGRRRLMLGAMLLYGCAGVAPFVWPSFQAVLMGRILLGIAEAFILTIGNALLADYYTKEEQHQWLMVQGIVGPFLGTVLLASSGHLAAMGWQWPFALYALTFPILFFGFDADGDEPSVDYAALLRVFRDADYQGFMSSEWEGHAYTDEFSGFEMVKRHQALCRRLGDGDSHLS